MKLIVRDSEIADFLISRLSALDECKAFNINHISVRNAIQEYNEDFEKIMSSKSKLDIKIPKLNTKFKDKLKKSVKSDLKQYISDMKEQIVKINLRNRKLVRNNISYFINKIGLEKILSEYEKSNYQDFIKGTGKRIAPTAPLIRRINFKDYSEDCLFRNMADNEEMLLTKMNNNYKFWFIDTGYTNFLDKKHRKNWHRLVRNNLHHINTFDTPVDRLEIFESFPKPWRNDGEKIMVIEPGTFSAKTFGVDIAQWKRDVEQEIRKHSDKPIVFREKLAKKSRKNLYRELLDEDYHCIININSNAAIEAVWAGVPAITLGDHITNSITRNNISDINNLLKPHLAVWLSMLSYSQFTNEELANGTAVRIVKKYHG